MQTIEVLKNEFIVPSKITELFYCIYADHSQKRCSALCKGFYGMRELIRHLRQVHSKDTEQIAVILTPKQLNAARVPKTYMDVAKHLTSAGRSLEYSPPPEAKEREDAN